ncbi:ligand-binding sensor domain-containing protein [Winogradskyella jejuensis]|uniref:Two component regulator propeller n=1 Tax=Winogradskyella jejuensis TaxID=1089305 RepID=A0A1M5UBL5_9FLAO|nr:LytTR family transcriptional regulator DNA-binding domain-containing protein [Winogradskyella jejuensis]SHH60412.1 Two component regulator propeller [Winogradskyella jejuensis]
MKAIKSIFVLLLALQIGYSQTYIYEHFGVDEGFPSSEVYDVYQDKLGYIWFATDKGLSRFNGYEFKNYTTEDGLPGNTILDFYPQYDGKVFCFELHTRTLFYFDEVFDGFKIYPFNDILRKVITPNTTVKSIFTDKDGSLLLGGYLFKGFIKVSNDGNLEKIYNKDLHAHLPYLKRKNHTGIGILSDGNAFSAINHRYSEKNQLSIIPIENSITSRLDVIKLNDNQHVFIDHKLGIATKNKDVKYYETEQFPIGIQRISDSSFWVGYYSKGAEIRDTSGNILDSFLQKKSVSNFLIDAEGSYWFTTLDDGVYRVKNPKIKVYTNDNVVSLVKDDKGQLFLGYHNGNIARILNFNTELLYKGKNDRPAFVEFNSSKLEVHGASDFKMLNLSNKQEPTIFINGVRKLSEDVLNPLINVASNVFKMVEKDSIVYYDAGLRTEDVCAYKNNVLIATPSGLYIQKDNKIMPHQPSPLLKSRLYDLDTPKETNTVYMASQDNGVIVYNDSIYNITTSKGLTNNIVNEVHIENDSTVWACTNTGLNRIKFKSSNTFSVDTITKSDGLLSNDINDVEIINDTVWVATKRGLCFFKKDLIDKKDSVNVLSLNLKDVRVNKTKVDEKNIKLKHNQNSIDFEVEAVSHRNVDKIEYLYRLKEIDSSWSSTVNRTISFPSLSPGIYTFEAKAEVNNIENNLLTSYSFQIQPPFWKSWWFKTLAFIFVSGLFYLFFKLRVLSYNKDIIRELMRLAVKRLKRKEQFYKFRANGEDFKIPTHEILFVHSQGNYLDIVTLKKAYTIRCKIGDFISSTPDSLEYLRVHRSYIIRIDQVSSKGRNWVVIKDNKIPVGETYLKELENIKF